MSGLLKSREQDIMSGLLKSREQDIININIIPAGNFWTT